MYKTVRSVVVLIGILVSASVYAQATRTWVSGVGDDANPCSRTAPCKTFAGAISKTAAGGEISVLDPGGFGAVNITKSMTLNGTGTLASILFSGTNGIIVNGAGITVNLIGLSLNGGTSVSPGINGIRIIAAAKVTVSNCDIWGHSNAGILDERNTAGRLTVTDTRISNPNGSTATFGIRVKPTVGTPTNRAALDRVTITGHTQTGAFGLSVADGGEATVMNSAIVHNDFGVVGSNTAKINLFDTDISHNGTGVTALSSSIVRLGSTLITANFVNGLGGTLANIQSFGGNRIAGNTGNNGAGMSTIGPQ